MKFNKISQLSKKYVKFAKIIENNDVSLIKLSSLNDISISDFYKIYHKTHNLEAGNVFNYPSIKRWAPFYAIEAVIDESEKNILSWYIKAINDAEEKNDLNQMKLLAQYEIEKHIEENLKNKRRLVDLSKSYAEKIRGKTDYDIWLYNNIMNDINSLSKEIHTIEKYDIYIGRLAKKYCNQKLSEIEAAVEVEDPVIETNRGKSKKTYNYIYNGIYPSITSIIDVANKFFEILNNNPESANNVSYISQTKSLINSLLTDMHVVIKSEQEKKEAKENYNIIIDSVTELGTEKTILELSEKVDGHKTTKKPKQYSAEQKEELLSTVSMLKQEISKCVISITEAYARMKKSILLIRRNIKYFNSIRLTHRNNVQMQESGIIYNKLDKLYNSILELEKLT